MRKSSSKKLRLKSETLAPLQENTQAAIGGGHTDAPTCIHTCTRTWYSGCINCMI